MIYTDKTKKAMKLCYDAHKGQVDKSGLPYVFHPFHVAEQMTDEATTIVALLHDVVEDTDYTLEDLAAEGFGKDLLEAVALMTHEDDVPYLDYVTKLKGNPIARAVKLLTWLTILICPGLVRLMTKRNKGWRNIKRP